jgi:hypothetical protein
MTYAEPRSRPDWVMVGVSHDGGVTLYASRELNYAELVYEADYDEAFFGYEAAVAVKTSARHRLTADLRTFVLIQAPDYPAAFTRLWGVWSPETAKPAPAITAGQAEQRRLSPP